MAKRRATPAAPQRGQSGETSLVLIFFLVFSILLNIGLGVATYFGFQHDDAIKQAEVKAENELKTANSQRDLYKFEAMACRSGMGLLKADEQPDLGTKRQQFDSGQLGKQAPPKELEEVKAFITTTLPQAGLKWDGANNQTLPNYEAKLNDAKLLNEKLLKENQALQAAKNQAETRKSQVEKELKDEKDNHDKNYRDLVAADNKKLDDYFMLVAKSRNDYENLTNAMAKQKTDDDGEKHKVEQKLLIADAKINGLKEQLENKNRLIARYEKDLGKDAPGDIKMDWRIVSIGKDGTTAYINLGSADKVVTGLTFRVHGIGEDGKPKVRDKANVEVLNVVADHLSEVRVLYDYDERKEPQPQRHSPRLNPVLKGDVLYNPTWDPYQKKHIAIAGKIDLVGDGRDSLPELVRSLERQNVVVDAYLDSKDFTIKGPGITVNTDLLIVGPTPRGLADARGADLEMKTKLEEGVRTMKKQAEDNGVKLRGLRQWLEEIGYKVPRGIVDEPAYITPAAPAKGGDVAPPPVKPPDMPIK